MTVINRASHRLCLCYRHVHFCKQLLQCFIYIDIIRVLWLGSIIFNCSSVSDYSFQVLFPDNIGMWCMISPIVFAYGLLVEIEVWKQKISCYGPLAHHFKTFNLVYDRIYGVDGE